MRLVCIKIHTPNSLFKSLFTKTFSITEKIIPNDSIPFWDSPNVFVLLVCCMVDECGAVHGFKYCVINALLPYLVRRPARVALLSKTKQYTSCSSVLQYSRSFFSIMRICLGYQQDLSLILCADFLTIYFLFLQIIYSKPFHISLDMDG